MIFNPGLPEIIFTKKFTLKFFGDIPHHKPIDFSFLDDTSKHIMCYTLGTTLLYMCEYNAYHMDLLWNPYDIELANYPKPYIRVHLK